MAGACPQTLQRFRVVGNTGVRTGSSKSWCGRKHGRRQRADPAQFGALAEVPAELEWLANLTNPKTVAISSWSTTQRS
jgi:hypothetical protein